MGYLTEALALAMADVVVEAQVTVAGITWDRVAVTVLVTVGAPARCGNRLTWKQVSDNLRGLMLPGREPRCLRDGDES